MGCFNKKGSSHFEIIISFVLFVGFTLFLVLSLEPTKKDLLEESILFGLENSFTGSVTTNLTSVLVDFEKDNPGQGNSVQCNSVCVPLELDNSENKRSLFETGCAHYIYSSEDIDADPNLNNCGSQGNGEGSDNQGKKYSLGYIDKQILLSNKSLFEVKVKYYSDYDLLKEELDVPIVVDFAVDSSDNNFDMSRTVPDDAEVIANTLRRKVLYANGTVINHEFVIKVW